MGRWIIRFLLVAVLAGAGIWAFRHGSPDRAEAPGAAFRTAAVTRGDLVVSITSTGTLQPEKVIDVGAQVAGLITAFGDDLDGKPVDYGSRVEEGAVLARIDDAVYAADLAQAEAQVAAATSGVLRAEADLAQARARHAQAARDWKRAQALGPSEALSQAAYDGFQAAHETTLAAVAVAEAAVGQARAQIAVSEAQKRKARRNLDFCTIRTPVTGVVIDRRVNIGQTVVASLNAPSLFLLAKDLTRLQVWAQVNEADIARIRPGQKVALSVDAFPGETFAGEVAKVRLNASMSQNVVTYTVEISLDNREGKLLPYLTASAQFEIRRKPGVLLVPTSALRWSPSPEQQQTPVGPPASVDRKPEGRGLPSAGTLWVSAGGGRVKPLKVAVGDTDGVHTEISGEGVVEGLEIVTGVKPAITAGREISNPFAPRMMGPGGGRPSGGRTAGGH